MLSWQLTSEMELLELKSTPNQIFSILQCLVRVTLYVLVIDNPLDIMIKFS